jgi:hypothetical protein
MSQPPWQGNWNAHGHGPGGPVPPQNPQAHYGPQTPQAHHPQNPQAQYGPQAPQRPGAVLAAAVLGGLVALVIIGVAVYTLVVGWSGASGGGEIVVVLLAFIIGGVGALHALGVAGLLHPRFPGTARLAMAGWTTMVVVAFGVFRSVRRLSGADLATLLVWIVLAAVVITLMVLITRPAVVQWVRATHEHSRRLGYVPKQRRR